LSGVREYDAVHAGMPADLLLISDDLVLQKVFLGGVEH
jgi:hypothetical protein